MYSEFCEKAHIYTALRGPDVRAHSHICKILYTAVLRHFAGSWYGTVLSPNDAMRHWEHVPTENEKKVIRAYVKKHHNDHFFLHIRYAFNALQCGLAPKDGGETWSGSLDAYIVWLHREGLYPHADRASFTYWSTQRRKMKKGDSNVQ